MGTAASVMTYNYEEEFTVFSAARAGDVELLKYFTDEQLNSRDDEGHTPI